LARIVGESNPGLTGPIGISILAVILVAILGSINQNLFPTSEENFWSDSTADYNVLRRLSYQNLKRIARNNRQLRENRKIRKEDAHTVNNFVMKLEVCGTKIRIRIDTRIDVESPRESIRQFSHKIIQNRSQNRVSESTRL
jgi:hypothetical protein